MTELNVLFNAVLGNSTDEVLRDRLREELSKAGGWDWPTVLRFVLDHPDSDGPRRLAADWLAEDSQDDRAEFIRVQCRLVLLLDILGAEALSRPDVAMLLSDERRLAAGLSATLTGGLIAPDSARWSGSRGDHLRVSGGGVALDYVRGFAGRIELSTQTFLRRASDLFRTHPIAAVRLTDKTPVAVAEGWWWADTCLSPTHPACLARSLPRPLYGSLLRREVAGRRRGSILSPAELTYPTPEAAHAALSDACVAHGRSLAELPPLAFSTIPDALS